jgi:hypothetical protein
VRARGKEEAANRQQEERKARRRNRSEYPHWALQRVTSVPRHSAHIPHVAKEEADAPTDDPLPEIQQADLLPRRTVSNQGRIERSLAAKKDS